MSLPTLKELYLSPSFSIEYQITVFNLGNVAGLDTATLNWLSWGFVIQRMFYNVSYWKSSTYNWARTRSILFNVGLVLIWTLWWKSMNAFLAKQNITGEK